MMTYIEALKKLNDPANKVCKTLVVVTTDETYSRSLINKRLAVAKLYEGTNVVGICIHIIDNYINAKLKLDILEIPFDKLTDIHYV